MAKEPNKPKNKSSNTQRSTSRSGTTPKASTQRASASKPSTRATAERQAAGRTAERRKERERERRRQQIITGAIIISALVLVAVFVFLIVRAPAEAPIPEAALTRYDGVQQSRTTPEGFPRIGNPGAPIQVAEYSSFDCPHCQEFHTQMMDALVDRVRGGYMALTFVPLYGYGSYANGQGAAAAAVCAAAQGKFWQFQDALFDWQGTYANQAFTNNRILAGVDALGLDRGQYDSCVAGSGASDVLNAARTQVQGLINFQGTPTITINGAVPPGDDQQPLTDYNAILARIDEEIARVSAVSNPPAPAATGESTSEPVIEATLETTDEAVMVAPTPEVTAEMTAER